MTVPARARVWDSVWLGALVAVVVLPLRISVVWLQRGVIAGEDARTAFKVSAALAPTLIFTLVLATILHEQFAIPDTCFGALLVYAGISTMLPTLILRQPFDLDAGGRGRVAESTTATALVASAAVIAYGDPPQAA